MFWACPGNFKMILHAKNFHNLYRKYRVWDRGYIITYIIYHVDNNMYHIHYIYALAYNFVFDTLYCYMIYYILVLVRNQAK